MGGLEELAIESVPVAGVDGAVGIFYHDAMNGKIDNALFADGEVVSEGGVSDVDDVLGRIARAEAGSPFDGLGDEFFVEPCFGKDIKFWPLEVEAVAVSRLDDQVFSAAAVNQRVEDFIFCAQRFR